MLLRFIILLVLIAGLSLLSIHVGLRNYTVPEVLGAFSGENMDADSLIILNYRFPRLIVALVAGCALGVSGLLMQTVTKNPIAEPGLFGINAGAAFSVVVLMHVYPQSSFAVVMVMAVLGAAMAVSLVFGIAFATNLRANPIQLLLAGVVISALLGSGTQVLIILNEAALEELLFWMSGSFADRDIQAVFNTLPFVGFALVLSFLLSDRLQAMQADDTTATSLGINLMHSRILVILTASILSAMAVTIAGPVAFIGLAAPHLARFLKLSSFSAWILASGMFGMVLAVTADIVSRFILYPSQAPVGAVMAIVGVPFLIFLLRTRRIAAT